MQAVGQHRWCPEPDVLDPEQLEIINTPFEGSSLVYGPAGTGKTVITLYRAKTLLDMGKSVKVFVYTNVLVNYIQSCALEWGFPPTTVESYYRWVWHTHRDHIGIPLGDGSDAFGRWTDALIGHFTANPDKKPHYDNILVDEAQDLPPNAARLIHMLSENVLVVGDTSQSLYLDFDDWRRFPEWWSPLARGQVLLRNYRNPRAVARVAAVFLDSSPITQEHFLGTVRGRSYDEKPTWLEVASFPEQVDTIAEIIRGSHGVERIGILFRHHEQLRSVAAGLQQHRIQFQIALRGEAFNFNNALPILTTIHSAKGIEFDRVILPDLNAEIWDVNQDDPKERRLFFVALTRTKNKLTLISHKGRACAFLREIPTDLLQSPKTGYRFNSSIPPTELDPF